MNEIDEIAQALNVRVRKGEDGEFVIQGSRGNIHRDGTGYSLAVFCESAREWGFAKKDLSFCRVTQDGDQEGVLHLARLPDGNETQLIRERLGIRRIKEVSPENLAAMVLRLKAIHEKRREGSAKTV